MTWVEWISLSIIGISTIIGGIKGIIKEVLGLLGLIIGNYISIVWSPFLSFFIVKYIKLTPSLARIVSYIIILFPVLFFFQIFIRIAQVAIKGLSLRGWDRLGGAFFGFLKGLIWVIILLLILVFFPLPQETRDYLDKNSYLIKQVKMLYLKNYINQINLPNWKKPFKNIKIPIFQKSEDKNGEQKDK